MKKGYKIIFLSILLLVGFSACANFALATPVEYHPQVTIPGKYSGQGINFGASTTIKFGEYNSTAPIGQLIKWIYGFATASVGMLAAVMLMVGGFTWLTAGGSGEKVSNAQSIIRGALLGLALTMGSYMLLRTVNPNLTDFKISTIKKVDIPEEENTAQITGYFVGCCQSSDEATGGSSCYNIEKIVSTEVARAECLSPVLVIPNQYFSGNTCASNGTCTGSVSLPVIIGNKNFCFSWYLNQFSYGKNCSYDSLTQCEAYRYGILGDTASPLTAGNPCFQK